MIGKELFCLYDVLKVKMLFFISVSVEIKLLGGISIVLMI